MNKSQCVETPPPAQSSEKSNQKLDLAIRFLGVHVPSFGHWSTISDSEIEWKGTRQEFLIDHTPKSVVEKLESSLVAAAEYVRRMFAPEND